MKKPFFIFAILFAAGLLPIASASAQQTPANSQPAPAAQPQQPASSGSGATPSSPAKPKAAPSTGAQKSPASKTAHPPVRKPPVLTLKTDKDKRSYAIGMNIGKGLDANIKAQSIDIDPEILVRAVKDVLTSGKTLLTEDEYKSVLTALSADLRKQQQEKARLAAEAAKKAGDANKKAGDEFLANNKSADGVVALPSGLQYKIVQEGTGPKPAPTDSVVCNYRGTLLDGTEFDSSIKRGKPATFPVTGVIKGWTEALQLMPVGSKWQLFIPPDLAYGDRGAGPTIGPNSTLIFEVELLSIEPKPEAPKAGEVKPDAAKPDAAKPDAPKPAAAPVDKPAPPPKPNF
jgi:FKBP-type peptidyl-prolyl cis-trans isomerase FklB